MRISIIGLPASGKSTFAEAISKKLSIPHIHLDKFWFESGGKQGRHDTPNIDEVRVKVREKIIDAVKADSWVSDGVYMHSQDIIAQLADVIIFLDIPLWKRLLSHAKRSFFEPKRHEQLSLWDEITFFREIIRRDFSSKPKLLKFVSEQKDKIIILQSRKQMNDYIKNFLLRT